LIAFGIVFSGFFASAAAIPTPSVPWNEKPATRNAERNAPKPPTNGAFAGSPS
jgi:hypothetical protein